VLDQDREGRPLPSWDGASAWSTANTCCSRILIRSTRVTSGRSCVAIFSVSRDRSGPGIRRNNHPRPRFLFSASRNPCEREAVVRESDQRSYAASPIRR
jgi:hypothetical protein